MKKKLRSLLRPFCRQFAIHLPLFSIQTYKAAYQFAKLIEIVKRLRSPQGCSWDRKQTLDTILSNLREEIFEAIDAGRQAIRGDYEDFCEELGDVSFLIIFLSQLSHEKNAFHISDVIKGINQKMIRRHPHVFGDLSISDTQEIAKQWAKVKSEEKLQKAKRKPQKETFPSILSGIPNSLPALHFAQRISEKVAQVGFDWPDIEPVWDKLFEEVKELQDAIQHESKKRQSAELGDLLFTIVNIARHLQLDGENALHTATKRFQHRFEFIEQELHKNERNVHEVPLEELEIFWQKAKNALTHQE